MSNDYVEPHEPRTKALTATELENINHISNFKAGRVADKIEAALRISGDADKEKRLAAHLCRACHYIQGRLVGHAFTQWSCTLCGKPDMHSNTGVPRVCVACCEAFDLCHECGGDIEMKRRSKFGRRARKAKRTKK